MPGVAYEAGFRVGNIGAIIICPLLSFLILKEKKLLNNFGLIILAILSGLIAVFVGAIGGLIPIAYLTTRPTNTN